MKETKKKVIFFKDDIMELVFNKITAEFKVYRFMQHEKIIKVTSPSFKTFSKMIDFGIVCQKSRILFNKQDRLSAMTKLEELRKQKITKDQFKCKGMFKNKGG